MRQDPSYLPTNLPNLDEWNVYRSTSHAGSYIYSSSPYTSGKELINVYSSIQSINLFLHLLNLFSSQEAQDRSPVHHWARWIA